MISAPSERSFADWKGFGAKTTHDNNELVDWASIIFLCMKPYQFEAAAQSIQRKEKSSQKLVVSTLSGTSLESLNLVGANLLISFEFFNFCFLQKLKNLTPCSIIRSMPNTPLLVGAGCTGN